MEYPPYLVWEKVWLAIIGKKDWSLYNNSEKQLILEGLGEMTEARIAELKCEEEYVLKIHLQNGHTILFNMEPKLVTARFRDLADREIFHSGRIEGAGRLIRWNNNTELSVEEIILNVKGN